MKVVFFEDVEGTAQVGEVKEVKNGFARNFLLPRGVAGSTSKDNLQRANSLAQKEARRQEKLDGEARGVAGKLDVDSKIVLLAEPIREIGQKQVTIKFTRNVTSEVTVDVVPDEASKPVVEKFLAEKNAQAEADAKIAAEKKALAEAKAAEEAAAADETEEE